MSWTAIVPLKAAAERKGRLSPRLGPDARARLAEIMAEHVFACLARCAAVERIVLLSPEPPQAPGLIWRRDLGRGLNAELEAARTDEGARDLLVIHADLPLLEPADIEALTAAAYASGWAAAPDRHGRGTNALAITAGCRAAFAFGPDSLSRHLAQTPPPARVDRPGLRLDVDTPDDLDAALVAGFVFDSEATAP